MGIDFKDVDVTANTLVDVFGNLHDANLSAGQIMQAFGKVIGPQMQVLIRTSREELQKYTDELVDTNKAFLAAHIQMDTLKSDWTILKSAMEAFNISIGKGLTPMLRALTQATTSVVRGVNSFIKTMQGARTTSDDFGDSITRIKKNTDDYARLNSMLTAKTDKLTKAERALYEIQVKRLALDLRKELVDINKSYDETIKKQEKLNKVYSAASLAREQVATWTEMVGILSEVQNQEDGATQAQTDRLTELSAHLNTVKQDYEKVNKEVQSSGFLTGMGGDVREIVREYETGVRKVAGLQKGFIGTTGMTVEKMLLAVSSNAGSFMQSLMI